MTRAILAMQNGYNRHGRMQRCICCPRNFQLVNVPACDVPIVAGDIYLHLAFSTGL